MKSSLFLFFLLISTLFCQTQPDCDQPNIYCVDRDGTYKTIAEIRHEMKSDFENVAKNPDYPENYSNCAGVKVYIKGGVYEEEISFHDVYGSKDNPITIQPFPNEIVTIKLTNEVNGTALEIGGDYIKVFNGEGLLRFETRENYPGSVYIMYLTGHGQMNLILI